MMKNYLYVSSFYGGNGGLRFAIFCHRVMFIAASSQRSQHSKLDYYVRAYQSQVCHRVIAIKVSDGGHGFQRFENRQSLRHTYHSE
jgi:hypothetical protein